MSPGLVDHPSAEEELPPLFLARLREILPDPVYGEVLQTWSRPRHCTFRINTLLLGVEEGLEQLQAQGFEPRPCPWLPEGFSLQPAAREALVHSEMASSGAIYIQDYSSMVPPMVLAPGAGEEVLDLAAAPGGKTLHMAAMMQDLGRLAAVEVVKSRFHRLRANVERSGASIIALYHKDGSKVGRQVAGRFDRVLLDAPCSSEARFKPGSPESWQYWSERKIAQMQRKQKQLLYSAVLAAKAGACIVYSTCSYAPEENEAVISHLLKKFSGALEVEPLHLPFDNTMAGLGEWRGKAFNPQVTGAVRILPSETMDGFFVCALRKL